MAWEFRYFTCGCARRQRWTVTATSMVTSMVTSPVSGLFRAKFLRPALYFYFLLACRLLPALVHGAWRMARTLHTSGKLRDLRKEKLPGPCPGGQTQQSSMDHRDPQHQATPYED